MSDILELTEAKIFQNLVVQLKNRFSEKATKRRAIWISPLKLRTLDEFKVFLKYEAWNTPK
jgi:hypothetical protein